MSLIPIIAGPCAAESREQILSVAAYLKSSGFSNIMRVGVWKPRSRPASFQGCGTLALEWLQEAKQRYGIQSAVEVASPQHVEACWRYGIDTLWLGARTVTNPFSVDSIAAALKGFEGDVMIKNPIHPDLTLWIGAIERLERQGLNKLSAIHRGFAIPNVKPYRNAPLWQLPIEFKRLRPDIPLWLDPSHMAGHTDGVFELVSLASDFAYDGLFVEVHPNPPSALSDPEQQLNFEQFEAVIKSIKDKKRSGDSVDIKRLRIEIDRLDADILHLLARRFEVVKELVDHKQIEHMSIIQMERWKHLMDQRLDLAQSLELDREFVQQLMALIHSQSIDIQRKKIEHDAHTP